eukprot:m.4216 g.4216  ORF g.4216 m.4216 type:complete len:63 (+) comp10405_c0_seq1:1505-1693(+)
MCITVCRLTTDEIMSLFGFLIEENSVVAMLVKFENVLKFYCNLCIINAHKIKTLAKVFYSAP